MIVQTMIEKLSQIYGDPITYLAGVVSVDGSRITEADWISYINSSARQIVLVRPDANSIITPVQLVPGTKQDLGSTYFRLLDVTRNMGADGLTPGVTISKVSRRDLDVNNSSWHVATADTIIDHFAFDPQVPRAFYVTPPAHLSTAVYIEIEASLVPTEVSSASDNIPLNLIFEQPLIEWSLFIAYSLDTDSPGAKEQSVLYQNSFYRSLGIDLQIQAGTKAAERGK